MTDKKINNSESLSGKRISQENIKKPSIFSEPKRIISSPKDAPIKIHQISCR